MQQKVREFQVNTAEIQQKLQFAQRDLQAEMRKDPIDQAKVESLWAELTNLKKELGEAQVNHMLAIKGILTPEQLEKLQKSGKTARELRELKAELREMLLAPGEPDTEKLKELQAKIAEKEVALEKERFEKITKKMASLSPEQSERIRRFWKDRPGCR